MKILVLLYFSTIILHRQLNGHRIQSSEEDVESCDDNPDIETQREDADDYDEDPNNCGKVDNFVGTNLFEGAPCTKACMSAESVALLNSRREFEFLIPKALPKTLIDDDFVMSLMQYFYGAKEVIIRMSSGKERALSERAFYDTLGGYLQYYVIPVVKTSFYAGVVCLKITKNVIEVYRQCKIFLNTNGNGWRPPLNDFSEFSIDITSLHIRTEDADETSCMHLELADEKENDDDMLVPLPKLDKEEKGTLSNIWLPFRRKKSFNLRSYHSAFIFLKYYEMVSRCYKYENVCQERFNKRLREWIEENLEVHLEDDLFYPGLGAILRVLETIKNPDDKKVFKKDVSTQEQYGINGEELIERSIKGSNEDCKKDFLNDLFGKFGKTNDKTTQHTKPYEDDEYSDEEPLNKFQKGSEKGGKNDNAKKGGSESSGKSKTGTFLLALWIVLAFILFFCICCIPLMIICYRKLKNSDDRICISVNRGSDKDGDSSARSKTSDASKASKQNPKTQADKSKGKPATSGKQDKATEKTGKKPSKDTGGKKAADSMYSSSETDTSPPRRKPQVHYEIPQQTTELITEPSMGVNKIPSLTLPEVKITSPTPTPPPEKMEYTIIEVKPNPIKETSIPAPIKTLARLRSGVDKPVEKPPNEKKFSISRKGRVAANDPLAQRMAQEEKKTQIVSEKPQKGTADVKKSPKKIATPKESPQPQTPKKATTKETPKVQYHELSSGWETTDWSKN